MTEARTITAETLAAGESARAAAYAAHRAALPGAGRQWLDALRDRAMDAFTRTGLPSRRMENWKYVDLRALAETAWKPARSCDSASVADLPEPLVADGPRIVVVDGRFRADLSQNLDAFAGVTVISLAALLEQGEEQARSALGPDTWHRSGPMLALNTAMASDGAVVQVHDGAVPAGPVEILHWSHAASEPVEAHARHAVVLGAGARLCVVERFAGVPGAWRFASQACHIAVGAGGSLDHVRLQHEPAATLHVAGIGVALSAGANYRAGYFGIGAETARVDLDAELTGEGASLDLVAAALARGTQQSDLTTRIRHRTRHGTSAQLVKAVVDDRARAVFQGAIHVEPDAQRTEAKQYSRAMLLSPTAEVDTKPELRIHADDVQCAHGAAIGDLDRDHLFYLRARGIDAATARAMLVEAFIAEAVERAPVAAARPLLEGLTTAWLAGDNREGAA